MNLSLYKHCFILKKITLSFQKLPNWQINRPNLVTLALLHLSAGRRKSSMPSLRCVYMSGAISRKNPSFQVEIVSGGDKYNC
jgi:hypothetical protein